MHWMFVSSPPQPHVRAPTDSVTVWGSGAQEIINHGGINNMHDIFLLPSENTAGNLSMDQKAGTQVLDF